MKRRRRVSSRALQKTFERILLACAVAPLGIAGACSSSSTPANEVTSDASTIVGDAGPSDADVVDSPLTCAPSTILVDASNPDGGVECGIFEHFSCDVAAAAHARSDCYFDLNDCPALCPGLYFFNCRAHGNWCVDGSVMPYGAPVPLDDGSTATQDPVVVECQTCPYGAGRRPRGLARSARSRSCSALGRHFAEAAHLEAASVVAFRDLRRQLSRLGAPRSLVTASARAARDEIRHARTTASLARRFGGAPLSVELAPSEDAPTLEDIARENAVEGCVRETFGALVATWQAAHAEDARVATAFRTIASEETRHAALSWSIAKWAEAKLDERARARVERAMRDAIRELSHPVMRDPHRDVVRLGGMPSARVQQRMVRELERTIWT